jgi:hypothetical protein
MRTELILINGNSLMGQQTQKTSINIFTSMRTTNLILIIIIDKISADNSNGLLEKYRKKERKQGVILT